MNDRLLPCDHVIFLIHPCLYEQQDAETVRQGNWQLYVERERQVKRRWLADLAARPPGTLYVQLGGPTYLLDIARSHLGAPYVCFPAAEHTGDLHKLYVALADCVREHVGIHKLRFDPRTRDLRGVGRIVRGLRAGVRRRVRAVSRPQARAAPALRDDRLRLTVSTRRPTAGDHRAAGQRRASVALCLSRHDRRRDVPVSPDSAVD